MIFEETIVWRAGDENLETFYIYGLLAAKGVLHVFAEGRIERHDLSPHHIVHRRSFDNGRTWEPTRYVVKSDNGRCYNNPVAVLDKQSGSIVLLYALNFENNRTRLFTTISRDNGETWQDANDVTDLFRDDAYVRGLHLPGPGHGLQLRSGRLIFPVWHRRELSLPPEERMYGISFIHSDDGGNTFENTGEIVPGPEMINESRLVETNDGTLLLNARSGAFATSPRYLAKSNDGGATWNQLKKMPLPHEAFATDSSFLRMPDDRLLFIRPDGRKLRQDLTAYVSENNGHSWLRKRSIYPGSAGYSDSALLNDGSIGVVYGRDTLVEGGDVEGNVRYAVFTRFDLEWLTKEER